MPRPKQLPDDIRMIRSCPAYMVLLQEREALRRATPGSAAIDERPASRRILSLPECIAPTPAFASAAVAVQLDDTTTSTEQSPIFPIGQSSSVSPHRERVPMDHVCNGSMYTKAELLQMDVDQDFLVPSAERLAVIQQEAIDAMLEASSGPRPCCVCELDWPEKDILCQDLTAKLVKDMKRCLIVALPPEFPEFIIKQYDASAMDVRLKGLMLLPLAVFKEHGVVKVNICKRCNNHLSRNVATPPTAAIANGNYIGHLPTPFQTMTRTDEQAISLVLPSVSLSVVTGGPCRTIKSHHYIVRNTEGPIVEMLPRDLSHRVRVTMVGSMTPLQTAACKKRYDVNISLCEKMLRFLDANNREYRRRQHCPNDTYTNLIRTRVIIDNTTCPDTSSEEDPVVNSIRDETTYSGFGSMVDENNGDPSVESTWIGVSSILIQPQPQDVVDILVRKSNDYVPMTKWAASVKMFPTLFPGGYGGPTEGRRKQMSVRKWILRCLQIHGHRFEKHYAFMLLAFDHLASQNARETLYFKMNVRRQALKAAQVKRSTVLQAIKYFNYLSECRTRGTKPRPPVAEVQRVIDLRKGLRVPESAFYGSNIGRMRARHDLFGMLKRFGPLQIFFTISPDSAGTYNIAVKSGVLSKQAVDDANIILMPNRAGRKAIAASYPVECARYFLRVMNTVIDVILGWDQNANAPRRGGGVFGVVRAFGAATETQLAGDLHAHFAVWLYGFPSTSSELAAAIAEDSGFCEQIRLLADRVLTTKPPCLSEENRCIKCHEDGTLNPIIPGVDAFRRPGPGATASTTSSCQACGADYKAADILDASIEALATRQNVRLTSQLKDFEKCRPPQVGEDNTLASSLLARDVQVHYWNHCRSCFKKTVRTPRGTVCRFLKPECVHLGPTAIENGDKLVLHRPIGCEYVNAYNRVILETLKCNHDAQFVLSVGAKSTAAYVIKYCFKHQNPVENQAALSLAAFAKAVTKSNALPPDTSAMERGYRILGSMLYTVTNGQEIAAPMAALYILHETPFWFSHEFVHVNLKVMLQKHDDSVEVNVSQQADEDTQPSLGIIARDNMLEKYWKRECSLESVSFIDICEQYDCTGMKRTSQNSTLVGYVPVAYCKREAAKVLVLCGDELPDIASRLERDQIDYYYTALLVLFKPHREDSLFRRSESPQESYHSFIRRDRSAQSQQMQRFEMQWRDYYGAQRCNDQEKESDEDTLLRTRPPATSNWTPVNDVDGVRRDTDESFDDSIPYDFLDLSTTTAPDTSTTKLSQDAAHAVNDIPQLQLALHSASTAYNTSERITLSDDFVCTSYSSQIIRADVHSNSDEYVGTHRFISQFRDAPTRLERVRECFAPIPHQSRDTPSRWTPKTLPEFPAIAIVSEAFGLNFWQHVAFEVAARHLLYAYSQDIASILPEPMLPSDFDRSPYNIKPQLIGYIGGEAGTGKSKVVEALLTFAHLWGREGSVETMAFTGVAAINIKGKTMHSARNLRLNGTEPSTAPTVEMKTKFDRVVLCIIDEISITDQALLGGMDAVSRSMTKTPEQFMGGKHTMLIGDLLQLPPVAGSPCFQMPPNSANRFRHAGFALYDAINFVVFLTRNMRARFDPEYTLLLDDLRWGRLSDEQIQRLNTRVLTQGMMEFRMSQAATGDTFYRPVVVCTNKLRCAINNTMVFRIAQMHNIPVYEMLAVPCARSKHIVDRLANADDNLTERIPMKLLFYIGMPVMVTRKHPALLEADVIANGVVGTIVGTHPPLEMLDVTTYDVSQVVIHRLVRSLELLLIKLHDCDTTLVNGFPDGVIGLPPLHISVRLKQIPNLSQASVTIDQFAIVPAFACTTEKLQGKTCHDGVVVTPLDRRRCGVPFQTLYVALSRAVSLAGLTLTEPITRGYLDNFKPTQVITSEMRRLIELVALPPYISVVETNLFNQWKARQHP